MTSPAAVTLTVRDDVPTVVVTGDLDLHAVEAFDLALLDELDPTGRVDVDLRAAGFVDSMGVSLLIDLTRHAGSVHLLSPPRRARRLLELTGITHLFVLDDVH